MIFLIIYSLVETKLETNCSHCNLVLLGEMSGAWKGSRRRGISWGCAPRQGASGGGRAGTVRGPRARSYAGTNCARSVLSRTRTGVGRCFVSGALPCCCVEPRRQTRSPLTDDVAFSVCASRTLRCHTQNAQRFIFSTWEKLSFLFSLDTARVVKILVHSDRWAWFLCDVMVFCGMCVVFTERVVCAGEAHIVSWKMCARRSHIH